MASNDLPRVLIASSRSCDIPSSEVVQGLLGVDTLPDPECPVKGVVEYLWQITNKYYTADVCVRCVGDVPFVDFYLSPHIECLLVTFNPNEEDSWTCAKKWEEYAEERSVDVRLLVCRSLESTQLSRQEVLEWCIDHEFELVEIEQAEGEAEDEEDGFRVGRVGLARCAEALNAHTWSNLQMKSGKKPSLSELHEPQDSSSGEVSTRGTDEACACANANGLGEEGEQSKHDSGRSLEKLERLHDEKRQKGRGSSSLLPEVDSSAFSALGNEEDGSESFEQLFDRFHSMKDRATNLPHAERKVYAEQVVMAFWKALGGDEEELAGLDDDEEPSPK